MPRKDPEHWFFNWRYPPVIFQIDLARALEGHVKHPHRYAKKVRERLCKTEIIRPSVSNPDYYELYLRLKSNNYLVVEMEVQHELLQYVKILDARKELHRTPGRALQRG